MKKNYLIVCCCFLLTQVQANQEKVAIEALHEKNYSKDLKVTIPLTSINSESDIIKFSLDELISVVVKNNAKLRYEKLNNEIIRQNIDYEKGHFESEFFTTVGHSYEYKQNSIQESIARDKQSTYKENVDTLEMGFKGISTYGTQWSASAKTFSTESSLIDQSQNGVDKEYVSGLYLEFKQPIIKNFGKEVGQTNINLAVLEDHLTEESYKKKTMDLVEEIVITYWTLYGSTEIYKTWKDTVELIGEQKKDIEKKVNAGNMASVNLLQIDSALISSKVEMLSALDMVEKEKNNILALLNTSVLEKSMMIETSDKPLIENIKVPNLDDAIKSSLANFPELNISLNKIEQAALKVDYAYNQTLPNLDLVAKVNNDNLDKKMTSTMSELSNDDYLSWYVGVNLSFPISGNIKATSELKKQRLKQLQVKLEENNLKINLINELDLKIKNLNRNKLRMSELKKTLDIKDRISESYTLQLKYGKSNAKELIDVYVDSIMAKRKYLKGIIEIKVAEVILHKAMGTLLEKHNIDLTKTGNSIKNEQL